MRAVNLLQELCILLKGIDWILKKKTKKNRQTTVWFLGSLLGTLDAIYYGTC